MLSGGGPFKATVIGIFGISLWATETVLITFTGSIPAFQIVFLAFSAAAILSAAMWFLTGHYPKRPFSYPAKVWFLTVFCLVSYHACIYYAVQNAPPVPAALLHGATPLMIVLGSALLPGERLRWWHVLGALLGLCGVIVLVTGNSSGLGPNDDPTFYLALVGLAAALWGIYSLASRTFSDVPTSAMGLFYFAAAIAAAIAHVSFETWVTPTMSEIGAIVALGAFPMGMALYFWDYGVKRGDMQALGGASYFEPLLGAIFVALAGQGDLHLSMLWAGFLIILGAAFAGRNVWKDVRVSKVTLMDSSTSTPKESPSFEAVRDVTLQTVTERCYRQPASSLHEILTVIDHLLLNHSSSLRSLDDTRMIASSLNKACLRLTPYFMAEAERPSENRWLLLRIAENLECVLTQLEQIQAVNIRDTTLRDLELKRATGLLKLCMERQFPRTELLRFLMTPS